MKMAKAKEAKSGKSQNGGEAAATDPPNVEVPKDGEKGDPKEGAVLTVIQKRLRAANKKLKRCEEIEAARAAGKTLNADQVLWETCSPLSDTTNVMLQHRDRLHDTTEGTLCCDALLAVRTDIHNTKRKSQYCRFRVMLLGVKSN